MSDALIALARETAQRHKLDPALVCAVVEQESGWEPWAIRFEPEFFHLYIAKMVREGKLHMVTEEYARAMSWGLMQLMGECAREHGYAGRLAALCDPATGLEWGCLHLTSKIEGAGGDIRQGLLNWNGGGQPTYADEVLARVPKYRT